MWKNFDFITRLLKTLIEDFKKQIKQLLLVDFAKSIYIMKASFNVGWGVVY